MRGELDEGEVVAAVDLEQRKVAGGIGADDLGGVDFLVIGLDRDRRAALDHVVVGYGVTVSGNEEGGAH